MCIGTQAPSPNTEASLRPWSRTSPFLDLPHCQLVLVALWRGQLPATGVHIYKDQLLCSSFSACSSCLFAGHRQGQVFPTPISPASPFSHKMLGFIKYTKARWGDQTQDPCLSWSITPWCALCPYLHADWTDGPAVPAEAQSLICYCNCNYLSCAPSFLLGKKKKQKEEEEEEKRAGSHIFSHFREGFMSENWADAQTAQGHSALLTQTGQLGFNESHLKVPCKSHLPWLPPPAHYLAKGFENMNPTRGQRT